MARCSAMFLPERSGFGLNELLGRTEQCWCFCRQLWLLKGCESVDSRKGQVGHESLFSALLKVDHSAAFVVFNGRWLKKNNEGCAQRPGGDALLKFGDK